MKSQIAVPRVKYKLLYAFILLALFFAPGINGRDYIGIIIVLICASFFALISEIRVDRIMRAMGVYAITIIALDLFHSFNSNSSFIVLPRIFVYAAIPMAAYIIGAHLSKKVDAKFFNLSFITLGILQALFSILQEHNFNFRVLTLTQYANYEKYIYSYETWQVGRGVGTLGNPNTYGVFMVTFIAFLINVISFRSLKKASFFAIPLLLSVYAVILSQSRTAYLLFVAVIILSLMLKRKITYKKILQTSVVIVILVFIILNVPFLTRRFDISSFASLGNRVPIWMAQVDTYFDTITYNILFGFGSTTVRTARQAIDNYYLQLLIQYGLIGLFTYIAMCHAIISQFGRIAQNNIKNFLYIAYGTMLISNITGAVGDHPDFIIFVFITIGFYCNFVEDKPSYFYNTEGHIR